jgi:dihydropteroate synthase
LSVPVSLDEELRRVIPAVTTLVQDCASPLSIDTAKAEVARRAVELGVSVVNDVSGLRDPAMVDVVAAGKCGLVLVHSESATDVDNVVEFVQAGLAGLVDRAIHAGVSHRSLMIDPGLGFGKTWRQNLEIVAHLADLRELGVPILVGASRKATISRVLGVGVHDRLEGTAALVAVSIAHGADVVRVHDCLEICRVARVMDAVVRPV